jgi:hypothetical protein
MAFFNQYFWLICGLWVGVVGALYLRYQASKLPLPHGMSIQEVNRFAKGWAMAILTPSLLFWLLQLTIGVSSNPQLLSWPSPQKWIAIGLTIACWLALLYWVWLAAGATRLSQMASIWQAYLPEYVRTPTAFKILSLVVITSGVFSLAIAFSIK